MKSRPTLTVVASEIDLDAKYRGDDDDDDIMEASCDIGETTLHKAGLRINRSGVTFEADYPDDNPYRVEEEEVGECLLMPRTTRKLVALDMLETYSMIGRGSSGQVFKSRHRESDTLYAVKVVTNVFDKPRRDQLLTEIRTLYGIESDHLVGFYGAYFQDHALSIVLEFCALGSLDQLLGNLPKDNNIVPERVVATIATQIITGLAHLKRVRHVHRDIKPQNILVQQDGAVKLTDFGLARELCSSTSMAQTFVGTFKYMAPERVQNEPYDYKSDIWSLGLVLIECATRVFPYANARSYIDVVQSIVESPEPRLPETDTNGEPFTPEFHEFISSCLKKEPSERASVEELLESSWLQLHEATNTRRCIRRCAAWFHRLDLLPSEETSETKEQHHKHYHDAKELKAKQVEDEIEIEECIETG
ncbi:hypothetical protein JM18_006123 [Phytophthora kernoviae]|uniref:mitogen-activated protein kinase kinase n=2 Tax=Phytophthora kernoviae TaxID=325452 RepID=A0A921V479_9STRA|nr:hypothetical protein G195_011012 [Phytophthora kernoviae 00238/432]KAG2515391.1 hypothetical protein JM18_006123 [Phytophthora kernoviae]